MSNFRFVAHEFDFKFHAGFRVFFSVADPDGIEQFPVAARLLNREPRSGHKVDTFESQPRPEVMQTDPLDGAAGN